MSGLHPHIDYVFAVAAYGPGGQLIGQSVGTPTAPILASYPLSHGVGCGLLGQYAYKMKNYSIAVKSTDLLWKKFVYSLSTDDLGAVPSYM